MKNFFTTTLLLMTFAVPPGQAADNTKNCEKLGTDHDFGGSASADF